MLLFKRLFFSLLLLIATSSFAKTGVTITSPDKNISFQINTGPDGLVYRVSYKGNFLINDSRLSISFRQGGEFGSNITLGKPVFKTMEEEYDLIIGKTSHVHSLSNEVMVPVIETGGLKRTLNIEIRIF